MVALPQTSGKLSEVVVKEELFYEADKVQKTDMGVIDITLKDIKRIPTLGGEQDVVKYVQLLPGVNKGVEGAGDFFVRGGDADQNLLLLDGATMYNTGHLFGFVSVFNPDVIGSTTFIKGSFPAYHGGRLSSILDVKTRDDIPTETEVEGTVGIISSRLTLRQPIKKDKVSLMVSGRRTYIDKVVQVTSNELEIPYYFYDFNGRVNYKASPKDQFFFSGYLGSDILTYQTSDVDDNGGNSFNSDFDIRNNSQSFGWAHQFDKTRKLDLNLSRTEYAYNIFNSVDDNRIETQSGIEDYAGQVDYKIYKADRTNIQLGTSFNNHTISPILINSNGLIEDIFPDSKSETLEFLEGAVYGHIEKEFKKRVRVNLGYRQSYAITRGKFYTGFEPRLALRYSLGTHASLKAGYSRAYQYMHRVSSSAVSLPVDLWYGVTEDIKPQSANQFALGYVKSFPKYRTLLETEVYYKDMQNVTEYQEGTNLLLNTEFEEALLQGSGTSGTMAGRLCLRSKPANGKHG